MEENHLGFHGKKSFLQGLGKKSFQQGLEKKSFQQGLGKKSAKFAPVPINAFLVPGKSECKGPCIIHIKRSVA